MLMLNDYSKEYVKWYNIVLDNFFLSHIHYYCCFFYPTLVLHVLLSFTCVVAQLFRTQEGGGPDLLETASPVSTYV